MIQNTVVAALFAVATLAAAPVKVDLKDAMGKPVGTATITEAKKGGVLIHMKVQGLPVGEHAAHIHTAAKCEGPAFTSAGGHFNPEMKMHGLDSENGPHAGDTRAGVACRIGFQVVLHGVDDQGGAAVSKH